MVRYLFFGALFGVILSRVGATDFDAIANMFLLTDLHLAGVIGVAAVVAGLILYGIHRQSIRRGDAIPMAMSPKPRKPGNVIGGLIFGAGWGLTGTCPGTGLAQLGEGQLMALFTVGGMFVGTALYPRYGAQLESFLARLSSSKQHRASSKDIGTPASSPAGLAGRG